MKRSLITEGEGWPLGAVIAGANVHDSKLLLATIEAIVVDRPNPCKHRQHLCLDKGFDNPSGRGAAKQGGYIPHIRRIGEEPRACRGRERARRWVVERLHSWLSKCRGILVRYAKKPENYLAFIQLASGLLWYRKWHRIAF